MSLAETCVMCGTTCDFLRFCDGLCVPCADRMMAALESSPAYRREALIGFAKACMRVSELEAKIKETNDPT